MNTLANKHILLGVTGGIAAYKAAELVRGLQQAGAEVRVVMTRGATAFITPMTLQALSGYPVRTELFDPEHEAAMGHIELARWADAVLVAPASADFMARLAAGMADDLLTTLCLATAAPLALAPAMNRQMWLAAATVENARRLQQRGVRLFGPAEGDQACGESGPGRMVEPVELIEGLSTLFTSGVLSGVAVTVTAGPTREAVDPVRFISNRSSGRMGYAIAAAAAEAGAQVRLVTGPVSLATPAGVERVEVETAEQMLEAVMVDPGDIFIGCAAVADYRPLEAAQSKIKKSAGEITLTLQRNPDILATVSGLPNAPFTVGFAAETDELESHARSKLKAKGVDMIAANWVGQRAAGGGFDSETNALSLFWEGGGQALPKAAKSRLARQLIGVIAERFGHNKGKQSQQ